jgi:drug/metabolite transporter (DMT)-like permease
MVCAHRSAKLIGGTEANFWRVICATLFLGVWSYSFGIGLSGEAFPLFLASGILGIGVGDVAMFQGLPLLGSRLSTLVINCLNAPIAALVEWWWLGTTLSHAQILCGLIILTGVGIALMPGKHLGLTRHELARGLPWCVVSALGGAGGAVLSRKAYLLAHASGQSIDGANAAFQRVVGGLLIAGICLLVVKRRALSTQSQTPPHPMTEAAKWRRLWPWVLVNGLAGQTLGVSCMQWALERTPTGIVLAIIATTPIVIIPFSRFFEGERPSVHSLVGSAVAVAGVLGLTLSR